MKTYVTYVLLILGTLISAADAFATTEIAEEQSVIAVTSNSVTTISKKVERKPRKKLVIITGARFVSIDEFLGLTDVNEFRLSSASSGDTLVLPSSAD